MTGEDSSYQAYTARKEEKLTHRRLDCGHRGDAYQHIWCDRLACKKCADLDHDCSAFGGAKSSTEEEPEPAEAAADLNAWAVAMQDWIGPGDAARAMEAGTARFRCRGCRLWIAQDVKLCGPCSALPSCSAERSVVEWGGTVVCFRPDGHDGQHESVQGRCWMDAPSQVEALRREPFLMAAIDAERAERDAVVARLAEAMTARMPGMSECPDDSDIEPAARRPRWKRWLP